MLTVYRRHNPAICKSTDRYYKRCTCPTWVEGTVGGKYIRRSLKTHSWERAAAKVREMDAKEDPTPAPTRNDEPVSIERAIKEYLADAKARELSEATLYRLDIIFRGTRLRTLTLLMRWSGLRIRDAITLEKTRLIGDNLMLYQAKTGTPVYVPLPPQVAEALRNIPDGRNQTRDIFSGVATASPNQRSPTGSAVSGDSSHSLSLRNPMGRQNAASRTCSAILLPWKCYLQAFRSTRSLYCSDTRA